MYKEDSGRSKFCWTSVNSHLRTAFYASLNMTTGSRYSYHLVGRVLQLKPAPHSHGCRASSISNALSNFRVASCFNAIRIAAS